MVAVGNVLDYATAWSGRVAAGRQDLGPHERVLAVLVVARAGYYESHLHPEPAQLTMTTSADLS